MKGDFTRVTFKPAKQFSRVLLQQGRVQLDADFNEQTAILLSYLRQLTADIIGPHGGPAEGNGLAGFVVQSGVQGLHLSAGHYYVDGILCDSSAEIDYMQQTDYPVDDALSGAFLVYLDVWEHYISHVQDDYIREKALAGPDTAGRARVVWQVKALADEFQGDAPREIRGKAAATRKPKAKAKEFVALAAAVGQGADEETVLGAILNSERPGRSGMLHARIKPGEASPDPCILPPSAGYRGAENQLYRVEIHNSGEVGTATFKWSRDNGSVIFPITAVNDTVVSLQHLGRDSRFTLIEGSYVEATNETLMLRGEPGRLLVVAKVDRDDFKVTLNEGIGNLLNNRDGKLDLDRYPILRRWDHNASSEALSVYLTGADVGDNSGNTFRVLEGNNYVELENGVEIRFTLPDQNDDRHTYYRTGDYWLIPARTLGGVEFGVTPEPPHGIDHHYAPLARVTVTPEADINITDTYRKSFSVLD